MHALRSLQRPSACAAIRLAMAANP